MVLGSLRISMRFVASARTRPVFTSRPSRSRICARWSGSCSGFRRQGSLLRSTASATSSAQPRNPDQNVNGAVDVAAWCDEEGHFGSFLGSRSYVGGVTDDDIDAARDRDSGRTMREALAAVGLAGRARAQAERGRHIGYIEAHIEQGESLESSGFGIGVVTSIVGIWQYRITFSPHFSQS